MSRTLQLDLTPEELHDDDALRRAAGAAPGEALRVVRRALDCRRRQAIYHVTVEVGDPDVAAAAASNYGDRRRATLDGHSPTLVIVGAGPAGLFAALRAVELGVRPVIVERGKPVDQRRRDVALLARCGRLDPDSNWCFGEGGAGTFSDGKLYTRSTKRGDVGAVLRRFVDHGADPDIMVDAHAHIGTDRLPAIIARMRATIEAAGGIYHFGERVSDIVVADGRALGVRTADGNEYRGDAVLLATGHSARDVYDLFSSRGWRLEAKPFALGVRVEHPQQLINELQYHGPRYSPLLPPAAYSLTAQSASHGVFSFCMCPGGVIVPAATAPGEQVVNGMSSSHRNSPWANSGIAVTVAPRDIGCGDDADALALLDFQRSVERSVYDVVGAPNAAPAQRLVDFMKGRDAATLPRSGFLGTAVPHPLHRLLPPFVVEALRDGFRQFDSHMRGFISPDALLLAVESRTSSPVRIPRDKETLQHPQLQGLYPCGEGAGYAGGIVSSALDGIRCVEQFYAMRGSLCSRK